MLAREQYLIILESKIKNKNLIKHCLAVEAAMQALARYFKEDEELWGRVGLIHDADWELTMKEVKKHSLLTAEWLRKAGETNQTIIETVLTHNYTRTGYRVPNSNLEWSLYCCDELTGLIIAVALVRPERRLVAVTVESVLKKFPQKAFAAGVEREGIQLCEEKLGIKLEEFVGIVLKGMQTVSPSLGL